jgi:hypothetical protein
MNRSSYRALRLLAAILVVGGGTPGFAAQEMLDVDSKFRAKIVKEKIKAGAQQRKSDALEKSMNDRSSDNGSCGSQSIGNVDTGRAGPAPREVFVFAPNAINIVGRGSC